MAGGGAGDEVTFGLREEGIKDETHVAVTRPQLRLGAPAPAPPLLTWVTLKLLSPLCLSFPIYIQGIVIEPPKHVF